MFLGLGCTCLPFPCLGARVRGDSAAHLTKECGFVPNSMAEETVAQSPQMAPSPAHCTTRPPFLTLHPAKPRSRQPPAALSPGTPRGRGSSLFPRKSASGHSRVLQGTATQWRAHVCGTMSLGLTVSPATNGDERPPSGPTPTAQDPRGHALILASSSGRSKGTGTEACSRLQRRAVTWRPKQEKVLGKWGLLWAHFSL